MVNMSWRYWFYLLFLVPCVTVLGFNIYYVLETLDKSTVIFSALGFVASVITFLYVWRVISTMHRMTIQNCANEKWQAITKKIDQDNQRDIEHRHHTAIPANRRH